MANAVFHLARPSVAAIVRTQSARAVLATPVIFTDASIIYALAVVRTIVGAVRHRELCVKSVEDVVRVAVQQDQHLKAN